MSNQPMIPYSTTIHVKDTCLCLHAQRAARVLARRFDVALKSLGLTNQQFSLMMSLNRPKPPSMAPVARLLAMDRTTLTAALKPLTSRGWVAVDPDPEDRRGKLLKLTSAGMAVLSAALPIWTDTHREIEAELSSGNPDSLRRDLLELGAPELTRPRAA
ncbi:MarR family transcriptional regulator [Ciceribacter sp. L1K22]|uniref:MarR family winged helix-turn-helix transcriptional regulator n=1 Tax=Ciceribacter sp. L1K22 TaxID=2820275 RepID=UPI001ABEDEE5|nr:MarR family transcriptional regulator [Ciceribacter sp. L1K22]MBO3759268.1 MarR family transcriptional regulator [Ciceribacter sp. L1K22]